MQINDTSLKGIYLIQFPAFADERGLFVKTFHEPTLQQAGLSFELKESFFSFSKKDVIRGMHFQIPPHDHTKIVFCPKGAILDVVVDIRKDSPTYGHQFSVELSERNNQALFIPSGFAHGFKSLEDDTQAFYLVSTAHHPASDAGIRYDSFGFDWGVENPIVSKRDQSFATLVDYQSPF